MSPMIVFVLSRTCNMVQYISEECFNYTSLSHASINAPHTFFLETFLIYIPITKTFLQEFFLTKCTVIITKDTGGLAGQGSSSARNSGHIQSQRSKRTGLSRGSLVSGLGVFMESYRIFTLDERRRLCFAFQTCQGVPNPHSNTSRCIG